MKKAGGLVGDVIAAVEAGRSPIVLTERTVHLDYLAIELKRVTTPTQLVEGNSWRVCPPAQKKITGPFCSSNGRGELGVAEQAEPQRAP